MTDNETGRLSDILRVLPISPGIALGPVLLLKSASEPGGYARRIEKEQVAHERQRLQAAIDAAEGEIDELRRQVARNVGSAEAEIFSAQQLMLRDPELLDEVEALMTNQLVSAEAAWSETIAKQSAEMASLPDPTLAARAADVRDIGARVLSHLQAQGAVMEENPDQGPSLIVTYDLTPSQTARLDPADILGICTVEGGPTTHAAIIARALEIPAVAGLDAQMLAELRTGQELAIDGERGLIYLKLDDAQRAALSAAMDEQLRSKRMRDTARWRTRPGETADGRSVLIYANVGDSEGARAAAEAGAQGIGLLRTEFLFGQRATFPTEQDEFAGYLDLFQSFARQARFQKIIVARTLDAGADKPFPALEPLIGNWHEANPALGLRGARIHLLHEELLRQQLRALLRAASEAQIELHIMFPMIATLAETRRMKLVLAEVRQALSDEGVSPTPEVRVGVMIETPAAVWLADALAREVDFFSIGANDLFQYTLAADRTNSRVMGLFGPLEPSLWRSINHVIQVARAHGRPVAVCGEIAADVHYGPLLAGLGIAELSVSPPALTRIKEALHQHEMAYWQAKASKLLHAETAAEMEEMLKHV
jgi:phosphoenolpyruvate-protein phosphotransferase